MNLSMKLMAYYETYHRFVLLSVVLYYSPYELQIIIINDEVALVHDKR